MGKACELSNQSAWICCASRSFGSACVCEGVSTSGIGMLLLKSNFHTLVLCKKNAKREIFKFRHNGFYSTAKSGSSICKGFYDVSCQSSLISLFSSHYNSLIFSMVDGELRFSDLHKTTLLEKLNNSLSILTLLHVKAGVK